MAPFGAAILARFGGEGKSDDARKSRIFNYLGSKCCRLSAAIDDLGDDRGGFGRSRTVVLWSSVGL
jgi:hypothetical protein